MDGDGGVLVAMCQEFELIRNVWRRSERPAMLLRSRRQGSRNSVSVACRQSVGGWHSEGWMYAEI
jgi:hypothetical protein